LEPLKRIWNNLTVNHRVMLVLVTVGSLVALTATMRWANQATYTTLYSNLAPEEAGEIVDELTTLGVSYRISAGGTAIQVADGEAQATRLKLASQGYPRRGIVGYEIFDQSNLGMTDFLQKVNFRRALEGEIAKTIMSLAEVSSARVHLVIPEHRLFARDQKQPTASVVLKLDRALSSDQVAGVQHLIASSVEGLATDRISILDYRGTLLTQKHAGDDGTILSSTQLDLRKNVEHHLESKAQTMLDRTLGPGRSVVRVIADLNFDKVETNAETYNPDQVAIRSEEVRSYGPGQVGGSSNQNPTITNYEVSRHVEHVVSAFGSIKRLSVAIMVDGTYAESTGAGEGRSQVYTPRSDAQLHQIGALVRTAVGFDSLRSDHMEIVNLAFDTHAIDDTREALNTMADYHLYYDMGKKALYGILLLVGLFYVQKIVKGMGGILKAASAPIPATGAALHREAPADPRAAVAHSDVSTPDSFGVRTIGRPEEVAKIIKTMMAE
jgi:flagellar M-ring protein FliF